MKAKHSRKQSLYPRRSILFVLLFAFRAATAQPPDPAPLSIHALESALHRDVVLSPRPGRQELSPLAPREAAIRTHTVFGFYPYWAADFSQVRFADLTHLAVFSVETNGSGQLVNLRGWPNGPLIEKAHQNGVRVVLVCTLFDAAQIQSLLSSSSARTALIANLRDQVLRGGADGVNIDFEGVPGAQKANLVGFMSELAAVIRAAVPEAHISIDTPAVDWSNAYDYLALAQICDALMIMAYDYHYRGSAEPGPVAPLSPSPVLGSLCVRSTLSAYLARVGTALSRKLILGVPYYGYDWPAESEALNARALGSAVAKYYNVASKEAVLYGRRWESLSAVPWYAYRTTQTHQVWYDDPESLARKYDLVFQQNLQGIGIWALTYDSNTTELWSLLEETFLPTSLPEAPELDVPAVFFDTRGLPAALRARGSVAAASFEICVGTKAGEKDIADFRNVGLGPQLFLQGPTLSSGKTYYLTARSLDRRGVAGPAGSSVAVRLDATLAAEKKVLPGWTSTQEAFTGLAAVNRTADNQAILGRVRSAEGDREVLFSWVLPPGRQQAHVLSETAWFGGETSGKEGWLEIAHLPDCFRSLFLTGDTEASRFLDGGPLQEAAADLVFPELDGGSALLHLANPNREAATLRMVLEKPDGLQSAAIRTLSGGELLTVRVADLFPELSGSPGAAPGGASVLGVPFLRIAARPAVAGSITLRRQQDTAELFPADPGRAILRSGVFSYVPAGSGYCGLSSLVNPGSTALTVEISRATGAPAPSILWKIPPNTGVRADLTALFPPGTDESAAIALRVTQGDGLIGNLLILSQDGRRMTALPLEPGPSSHFLFPHLAQSQGFWTGVSLANPEKEPVETVLEAFDGGGLSLGKASQALNPGERKTGLVHQWIKASAGISSGRLEIRASRPFLAAEIFGSDSLSFIAAVAGREESGQAKLAAPLPADGSFP